MSDHGDNADGTASEREPETPTAPEEVPQVKGFVKPERKSIGRTDEV